ncbi:hypothetical protein D9M71_813460 [compost metagenome]
MAGDDRAANARNRERGSRWAHGQDSQADEGSIGEKQKDDVGEVDIAPAQPQLARQPLKRDLRIAPLAEVHAGVSVGVGKQVVVYRVAWKQGVAFAYQQTEQDAGQDDHEGGVSLRFLV